MRRAGRRHHGILPLDTVGEHLARHPTTFTMSRRRMRVHADMSAGDAAMRDSAALHFGSRRPFRTTYRRGRRGRRWLAVRGRSSARAASASPRRRLWRRCSEGDKAPKIIARLPLSSAPTIRLRCLFRDSWPAADAIVKEVEVFSVKVSGWSARRARVSPLADAIARPTACPTARRCWCWFGRQYAGGHHIGASLTLAPRCARRPSSEATRPAAALRRAWACGSR